MPAPIATLVGLMLPILVGCSSTTARTADGTGGVGPGGGTSTDASPGDSGVEAGGVASGGSDTLGSGGAFDDAGSNAGAGGTGGAGGTAGTGGGDAGPDEDAGTPEDAGAPEDAGTPEDACSTASGLPPADLKCTLLYKDWGNKIVADDVREFDPGLHLWSDGAEKTRWVYLPPGTTIDTSNMDEWVFPVGTKFWKQFVLAGKRIETRLLWKRSDSTWYRTTYRWSADESTAPELTSGEVNADGNGFEIPTQAQCTVCHAGRRDNVLGFDAIALSSSAASGVTLADLAAEGRLSQAPIGPINIPGDAVSAAALSYLHANCGVSCHNRNDGEANISNFFTRLDVATLGAVETTDTFTTGMNVGGYYSIPGSVVSAIWLPCDPANSIGYYRMTVRDGFNGVAAGHQMPRIGSHKLDEAGVTLIAQWLNGQPECQP